MTRQDIVTLALSAKRVSDFSTVEYGAYSVENSFGRAVSLHGSSRQPVPALGVEPIGHADERDMYHIDNSVLAIYRSYDSTSNNLGLYPEIDIECKDTLKYPEIFAILMARLFV